MRIDALQSRVGIAEKELRALKTLIEKAEPAEWQQEAAKQQQKNGLESVFGNDVP